MNPGALKQKFIKVGEGKEGSEEKMKRETELAWEDSQFATAQTLLPPNTPNGGRGFVVAVYCCLQITGREAPSSSEMERATVPPLPGDRACVEDSQFATAQTLLPPNTPNGDRRSLSPLLLPADHRGGSSKLAEMEVRSFTNLTGKRAKEIRELSVAAAGFSLHSPLSPGSRGGA
nr:hypothetical protein Iba_chr06aCG13850 [Ipomoea batatas]